jgi:hypothetical protein
MPDCCGPGAERYDEVFDTRFAGALARRYRRRGLTASERRIVDEVTAAGVVGSSVLEIGGGVGAIQLELLRRGAARTVNLELSGAYEREAARLLSDEGLSGRARRIVGLDLASDGAGVPVADHVVLHRVVCCYPDAMGLLGAAASHASRTVTFSHPSRTWISRAMVASGNLRMRIRGREYRGYVHPPAAMYEALGSSGFVVHPVRGRGRWRIATAHRLAT